MSEYKFDPNDFETEPIDFNLLAAYQRARAAYRRAKARRENPELFKNKAFSNYREFYLTLRPFDPVRNKPFFSNGNRNFEKYLPDWMLDKYNLREKGDSNENQDPENH